VKPLADLPVEAARQVEVLLTDIDDTVTLAGKLPSRALAAMEAVQAAGVHVVPVTGRPAGWCDHIARMWPVSGVVGENGAFYFHYDTAARRLRQRFVVEAATRRAQRDRLAVIAQGVLDAFPGTALASDQNYREADIAIDFCEDVPALAPATVAAIAAHMRAAGLTVRVSSIHVNGWFGEHDKLSTTRLFARERLGIEVDAARERFLFAGDSPNDASLFAFFPLSAGVANVRDFAGRMPSWPAYVAAGRGSDGFVEICEHLLHARQA
jgi:hypothetical protein